MAILIVANFVLQQALLTFLQIPSFCSVEVIAPVWGTSFFTCVFFANLITYASSLFSFIKKNYLFHSNTGCAGTVSWEIPTPLNLFISLWSSRGALTLFSGQTRPFCIGTPGQRCSDASRLVLQGGILGWYYICTIITCRHVSLTNCARP